jgi:hypothetical protein
MDKSKEDKKVKVDNRSRHESRTAREFHKREPIALREGEPKPRPIGDRCNPLCPYFRCMKKALQIRTEYYRGRPIKVPICTWIGDKCIGPKCRYAYCVKHAMLPDGRCLFAVQAKAKKAKVSSFEEELKKKDVIDELEEKL